MSIAVAPAVVVERSVPMAGAIELVLYHPPSAVAVNLPALVRRGIEVEPLGVALEQALEARRTTRRALAARIRARLRETGPRAQRDHQCEQCRARVPHRYTPSRNRSSIA